MSVPVTLYSPDGLRSRQIAAIDAPGWIGKGWSETPITILSLAPQNPDPAIPNDSDAPLGVAPASTPLSTSQGKPPLESTTAKATTKRNDIPRDTVPEN